MTTYTATATREDGWWTLDVNGIGVTQCLRLADADAQVRGLIEAVTDADVPGDTVIDLHLANESLDATVNHARAAVRRAEAAQRAAAAESRATVRRLVDAGLAQSDVAVVLGVSKQRVSQLAHQ